ncbi:MAG TPA: beta-propeller domain-containing protein [Actinoplanes sp.]
MSARSLLCATAVLSAVAVAGCTADEKPRPSSAPPTAMRLVAFDSCAQLRDDLRAAATASVGPYGFPGTGGIGLDAVAVGGARSAMDSAGVPAAKAAPFSTTNTHEADADEPDIVKTDGRRIVSVTGDVLRVVDPATRTETGRLDLGADAVGGANLLLSGDKALVLMSGAYGYKHIGRVADVVTMRPQLLLVDLAGTPRVISRYRGEGTLVDARQTGSTARVVLRSTPRIKFPELPNVSNENARTTANRAAVKRAPADAWLPSWSVTTGGVTEQGTVGCDRVSRPTDYSASAMLTILTFDLGAASLDNGDPMSIVADGDTVYGTGTSLYVANDQRWRLEMMPQRSFRQSTEIYRFDTTGSRAPTLTASGSVPGWLVNQYALSEWDGYVRVATTDDRAGSSAVRVLSPRGRDLVQVGVVNGLGKGERIYSVRFVGPRGYVVTFKQTDPLYAVDLSDPAKPRVTGELKITGYSAHLQPVGDGRLVGIGQEASTQGRIQGTQVSLFDVSDPAAPRRLAQYHLTGAYSEAEWDPHALLWWPATGLLVVPVMNGYDGPAPGALALRVTDNGLAAVGTVRPPTNDAVRRSLVVGDVLWTLSDAGLQASALSTMDRLSWLPF